MNLLYRRNMMYSQQTYLRWLTKAAIQAILAAFGQADGWAVINATNAYLNQLAASGQAGKDKATALAGFINEDPMMVCSLGLQPQGVTMPIRYINGGGNGYFATGKKIINGDVVKFGAMFTEFGTQNMLGWRNDAQVGVVIFPSSDSSWYKGFGARSLRSDNGITLETYKPYEFEMSQQGLFVWNNTLQRIDMQMSAVGNEFPDHEYYIFAGGQQGELDVRYFTGYFSRNEINNGGSLRVLFLPKQVNGSWELLDVVSGSYATRNGTFTMEYRLPDGTTWTPSTP